MEITQDQQEKITILNLNGRLDTLSSNILSTKLNQVIEGSSQHLLLDLDQLDFISSSGLRVLLATAKQMKGLKRKLALAALQDRVKEVFDIAGFTMLFSIHGSKEEALKQMS